MKWNHILLLSSGLSASAAIVGLLTFRAQSYRAAAVADEVQADAPGTDLVNQRLSPEDQGFVDCPESDDPKGSAGMDTEAPPTESSCLEDLLPWGQAPAPLGGNVSLSSLEKICGAVFEDFLIYHGSGRCQWASSMFHGTDREILIVWHNWSEKKQPRLLRFVGSGLHFANGLRPGLMLKDLTHLNGGAIALTGFGWEGSGSHQSFQSGALQNFDGPGSPYRLRYTLDWDLFDSATDAEHASVIVGESRLESTEPALEKFKAQVEFVEFRFAIDDTTPQRPL